MKSANLKFGSISTLLERYGSKVREGDSGCVKCFIQVLNEPSEPGMRESRLSRRRLECGSRCSRWPLQVLQS